MPVEEIPPYVVCLLHSIYSPLSYFFPLSQESKVHDLEKTIREHDVLKAAVAGRNISFYKCGTLPLAAELAVCRAWVNDNRDRARMNREMTLGEYFPDGPSRDKHMKFDVVVAIDAETQIPAAPKLYQPRPFEVTYKDFGWIVEWDYHWAEFYRYWSEQDLKRESSKSVIALATSTSGIDNPDHRLNVISSTQDQVYVREFYRKLANEVYRAGKGNPFGGIIISGQPDTGKTTWLWFMLLCLIMRKEHVVFHFEQQTRLFYNGQVYRAHQQNPTFPIDCREFTWCLIDSDPGDPPFHLPWFLKSRKANFFPIHVSPLNRLRYSIRKERYVSVWGMPSWSREELKEVLKLNPNHAAFMDRLQDALPDATPPDSEAMPIVDERAVFNARVTLASPPIGREAIDNALRFAVTSGLRNDAESVLDELLNDAFRIFGGVPWNICDAVFNGYEELFRGIDCALIVGRLKLEDLTDVLAEPIYYMNSECMARYSSPFNQLFTVEPLGKTMRGTDDTLVPGFRSEPIGKMVMAEIGYLEAKYAKRFVNVFKLFPETSSFASWIFQGLAHEALMSYNYLPDLIPMASDIETDTKFVYVTEHTLSRSKFPVRERKLLGDMELDDTLLHRPPDFAIEEFLCVPKNAKKDPIFDSFCVDFNIKDTKASATIWYFQTTRSPEHDGSSDTFERVEIIREFVVKRANLLARPQQIERTLRNRIVSVPVPVTVKVELVFVMVCPSSATEERTWNVPKPREGFKFSKYKRCRFFCKFVDVKPYTFGSFT